MGKNKNKPRNAAVQGEQGKKFGRVASEADRVKSQDFGGAKGVVDPSRIAPPAPELSSAPIPAPALAAPEHVAIEAQQAPSHDLNPNRKDDDDGHLVQTSNEANANASVTDPYDPSQVPLTTSNAMVMLPPAHAMANCARQSISQMAELIEVLAARNAELEPYAQQCQWFMDQCRTLSTDRDNQRDVYEKALIEKDEVIRAREEEIVAMQKEFAMLKKDNTNVKKENNNLQKDKATLRKRLISQHTDNLAMYQDDMRHCEKAVKTITDLMEAEMQIQKMESQASDMA